MSYETVYKAMKIEIESYLVPRKLYDESQNQLSLLKSELEIAKSDLRKLKSEHSQLNETYNQLKDERLGDTLKIDVLQAEMKAVEAEKKTFEVKFDAVSSKLKLKTHEYDSLVKSKPKSQDIKIFVTQESQNVRRKSIGTQTIKHEAEEIGVVNVPASLSSQPKSPPAKTGTKRTSHDDDRKITKAKRKKTDSTTRLSTKSTENNEKITCFDCLVGWGIDVKMNHDGDPDKTGVPNLKETISTFSSFDDYKNHLFGMHDVQPFNCSDGGSTCKICGLKFSKKRHLDLHVDLEHMNLTDITNKQVFDILYSVAGDCL